MLKNHFIAEKHLQKFFLFDYYNLLHIQVDEQIYNCAVDYLSKGQTISAVSDIVSTCFAPYAEEIAQLLEENILISNAVLDCEIVKTYPKVYFSFPTIHKCNLKCKYCFADAGLNYKDENKSMTSQQIENVYTFLLTCDEFKDCKNYRLDFVSGGEPLLNFDLIKEAKTIGDRLFGEHEKSLDIWVCTNGILLDEEKAKYLNDNGIGIGVSLDGPKDVNDLYRLYPNEGSSYSDTVTSIARVIANKAYNRFFRDIWALTVITAQTQNLVNILEHHKKLGLNNVQMKIVRSVENSEFALTMKNTEHFILLYNELVNFVIERIIQDDVSYLKMILNGNDYLGKIIIRLILRDAAVYRCMAGRNKMSFAANGDIYPCDSFVGNPYFRIGNIYDGLYHEKIGDFYNMIILKREKCKNCWANIICGGDCYYNSYLKNCDMQEPDEAFCVVNQKLCLLSIKLVAYLSFEKPDLFDKVYQYLEKRKAFQ
jgi:uncharacterized protein